MGINVAKMHSDY